MHIFSSCGGQDGSIRSKIESESRANTLMKLSKSDLHPITLREVRSKLRLHFFVREHGKKQAKLVRLEQIALKIYLDKKCRQDFFKITSTHRDTSIPHVFGDVGSPEAPLTLSQTWNAT